MTHPVPSHAGAAAMSLEPAGPRSGADRGAPIVSYAEISNDGQIEVGVWECTPGGWEIVDRPDTEVVTIVSGRGTITDADGTARPLHPGAVVTLPKGWSGRWDIDETLRKVYVVVN